jgi:cystathionine beta-lyase/cystathionine gamma-synthase
MKKEIISESKASLLNSFEELLLAVNHQINILKEWSVRLDVASYLERSDKELVKIEFTDLLKNLETLLKDVNSYQTIVENTVNESIESCDLEELIQKRKEFFSRLRVCLSLYASTVTCLNWQSPAIKSSVGTRVGVEKSEVIADWNDYKRDRSEDTFYCENLLSNNIFKILNSNTEPILNIFNSGMGAFTAIIYFLVCEKIVKGSVLVSNHNYVENKILLKSFFEDKTIMFYDNDTDIIVEKIFSHKPYVVFMEMVSNTGNLRLFDIEQIIKSISEKYEEDIYFIIDVTCSVGFENLLDNFNLPKNIKIILHGSLLKAPQLGLERINMGFIQTFGLGELSHKILDYRTLSGTNVQDFAANLLPFTSKDVLQKRMIMIENNAKKLATEIEKIDINKEIIQEVVYPGLSSHKDFVLGKKIGFAGFFFNIKFIEKLNNDKYFEMYTREVIKIGKRENCEIIHGASFGFNHTSIYYSVGWDEPDNHYIRISTGIETSYEVEKIKKVLIEAFASFKKELLNLHLINN